MWFTWNTTRSRPFKRLLKSRWEEVFLRRKVRKRWWNCNILIYFDTMYEGNKVIALWGTILNLLWCNRDKIIASLFTALFLDHHPIIINAKFFFNAHYFVCNGLKINLKRRHFKLSDNFLKFFKGRSCIVMKRLLDRYPSLNWGRRTTFARSPLRMISSGFFLLALIHALRWREAL